MRNVIISILLLLAGVCLAGWERTYGGGSYDKGRSVAQTSDGGYIIAGYTYSFGAGNYDVYLVKTDAVGDTIWTRTYGGSDRDDGYSVAQTSDGGYIVAGYTESFGAGSKDVYLVKTDAVGDTIWTRTYGGSDWDEGYSVAQTSDGGYIVAGRTESFGAGSADVYLVKTDAVGDTIWTRTYGGSDNDRGYSVAQTSDGGYIVAGVYDYDLEAGTGDVYLVKTDAVGDTIWTRTYGGNDNDMGYSVAQTSDGGYIVAGWTESFGAGGDDVYLVKTDAVGDTIWMRTYGGSGDDVGFSVAQTSDGGYNVAGWTESFGVGGDDVYLVKTDAVGDTIWTRTYGGSGDDGGASVAQMSDGGYIVAGETESFSAGGSDVYLIKTNADVDTTSQDTISSRLNFAEISNPYSPQSNYSNPSTISWLDGLRLSAGYEILYTGMNHDNLSSGIVNVAYPTKKFGAVGFRAAFFKADHFSQNAFIFQYSYKFGERISAGLSGGLLTRGYNADDVEGFDQTDALIQDAQKSAFTLGLGGTYMIVKDTYLGFALDNILQPDLGIEEESKEPLSVTVGASTKLWMIRPYANYVYYSDEKSDFLVGIEGWFVKDMLGAKVNLRKDNLIFGMGIKYSHFRLDYDYVLPTSGIQEVSSGSHQMLLTYDLKLEK